MAKKSAENTVREHYETNGGRVRIERQRPNWGKAYYLVRPGKMVEAKSSTGDGSTFKYPQWDQMYLAEGDTPAQAWRAAADRLGLDYRGKK